MEPKFRIRISPIELIGTGRLYYCEYVFDISNDKIPLSIGDVGISYIRRMLLDDETQRECYLIEKESCGKIIPIKQKGFVSGDELPSSYVLAGITKEKVIEHCRKSLEQIRQSRTNFFEKNGDYVLEERVVLV